MKLRAKHRIRIAGEWAALNPFDSIEERIQGAGLRVVAAGEARLAP
jgi:hypothetical protein